MYLLKEVISWGGGVSDPHVGVFLPGDRWRQQNADASCLNAAPSEAGGAPVERLCARLHDH